jgi:hypothetical protein
LCRDSTDLYFPQLKNKPNDRLQLTVGAGFKIGRQVEFDDLHQLISDMALIATQSPKDYLSSYKEISADADVWELGNYSFTNFITTWLIYIIVVV